MPLKKHAINSNRSSSNITSYIYIPDESGKQQCRNGKDRQWSWKRTQLQMILAIAVTAMGVAFTQAATNERPLTPSVELLVSDVDNPGQIPESDT